MPEGAWCWPAVNLDDGGSDPLVGVHWRPGKIAADTEAGVFNLVFSGHLSFILGRQTKRFAPVTTSCDY